MARSYEVHFPWFSLPSAPRGRASRQHVWDRVRHAPPWDIMVLSYVQADRIAPQIFPFLSELSQVSRSDEGRVTPSAWAYFLRRRDSYSLRSGIFPHSRHVSAPFAIHIVLLHHSLTSRANQGIAPWVTNKGRYWMFVLHFCRKYFCHFPKYTCTQDGGKSTYDN